MTSRSDSAELKMPYLGAGEIPIELQDEIGRKISRLEFQSLNRCAPEVEDAEPDGNEEELKQNVAALGEQLRSQAEQLSASIERARTEGRVDARREWEEDLEERIAKERASLLAVCEEFQKERVKYFAGVEAEVVKLALAIAARVVHREVTLDPVLLAGVVRVALEKMADGSTVVLRVPSDELAIWQEIELGERGSSVRMVGDEGMQAGECAIDTNVGRVELGVSAQLEEIERGFFDLLQQRPV
jgi:flagellar assembly protein FliH